MVGLFENKCFRRWNISVQLILTRPLSFIAEKVDLITNEWLPILKDMPISEQDAKSNPQNPKT